jgi:hypothetical protein
MAKAYCNHVAEVEEFIITRLGMEALLVSAWVLLCCVCLDMRILKYKKLYISPQNGGEIANIGHYTMRNLAQLFILFPYSDLVRLKSIGASSPKRYNCRILRALMCDELNDRLTVKLLTHI